MKYRIKEFRQRKGLTQTDLAKSIGKKTAGHISDLEKGTLNLYLQDAIKISKALDCSLYDLIPEEESKGLKLVSKNDSPINFDKSLMKIAMEVIGELVEDEGLDYDSEKYLDAVVDLYEAGLKLKDERGKVTITSLATNWVRKNVIK